MSAFGLRSFRQQNLLVEYASLKHVQLRGVYVSLTTGDPTLWTGVLFVQKGPYASAVLRFRISFSLNYPFTPPLIIFTTDLFHPLLTPLTTYTQAGTTESDSSNMDEEDKLPAGAINIRYGFPSWRKRPTHGSTESVSELETEGVAGTVYEHPTIVDVLKYLRSCFEEDQVLDQVPFEAAGNQGAWYAWQAYRGRKPSSEREKATEAVVRSSDSESGLRSSSPAPNATRTKRPRRPSQWNWDGVWEERVKRAIQSSLTEPTLFGSAGNREDEIHFVNTESDDVEALKEQMRMYVKSVEA